MNMDALIRSVSLRDRHYMLFLGAGASVSSGIPTAYNCIWNWKRQIFLTNNETVSPKALGDISLPHVQQRIQRWLDQRGGYPELWDDSEYVFYIDKCFPRSEDRKDFFKELLQRGQPQLGYQCLGLLLRATKIKWLWTTNFDDLVERAIPGDHEYPLLQVGMDSSHRIDEIRREAPDPVQVFLHGDYRYDPLRNTERELTADSLDAACRRCLVDLCGELPLIVLGYSGRDDSVMSALTQAYSRLGRGAIYWGCLSGAPVPGSVEALLDTARANGVEADVFYLNGFDDFMSRLGRWWLRSTDFRERLERLLAAQPLPAEFSLSHLSPDFDWTLSNAFAIQLPTELFQFKMTLSGPEGNWKQLKSQIADHHVEAGFVRDRVVAIGRSTEIERAFRDRLDSEIEQVSLSGDELTIANGVVKQVLLSALVAALEVRGFVRDGRYRLRLNDAHPHRFRNETFAYSESVELSLDCIDGQVYLTVSPDVHIDVGDDRAIDKETIKAVKRDILWRQRNAEFWDSVKTWRQRLFGHDGWRVIYPPGAETGFTFIVDKNGPVFSRYQSACPRRTPQHVAEKAAPYEHFAAFETTEPYLQFGRGGKSRHPITGLISSGGPYETFNELLHSHRSIRVGVVCQVGHEQQLAQFLNRFNQQLAVDRGDDNDYVVDFPGFETAFGCCLEIPAPSDPAWVNCQIACEGAAVDVNRRITSELTLVVRRLSSSGQIDVVLLYIPSAWKPFESVTAGVTSLNLHDQVKAFCVQHHIRSQLLREEKVLNERSARIYWWLSLAFFTKSLRVPWSLADAPSNVVYAGIGYSFNPLLKTRRIVTGCCHVYDSAGLGLRFRLGELEKPIWKRDEFLPQTNPHMSRDDAYRLGIRTRQLFFESHSDVPDRVLVCKQTPFLNDEVEGLLSALQGINHVDLLTVQFDGAWRFCAFDPRKVTDKNATSFAHGFPIRRGSGVLLDSRSFLLWLHGNVIGTNVKNERFGYFQGKSRIPTPVRVTRYSGDTEIETLSRDLMGLTKMDWNTFALYRKLPAIITTPKKIARIASLLGRLPVDTYDYRLFM
jgi:hypothetical protein